VLWSGSRGYLGAFLTDQHFFVISTSLNAWRALPLGLDESGVSKKILRRGFDTPSN
jgi:hypothetical protein